MGYGDDIMATAEVERQNRALLADGRKAKFFFGNVRDRTRHVSPVFNHNPLIIQTGENLPDSFEVICIENYPGRRPYIDYENSTYQRLAFRPLFRATPGHLFLTRGEIKEAKAALGDWVGKEAFVLVEPHVKATFSARNKDWGFARWCETMEILKGRPRLVQVGADPTINSALPYVQYVRTPTFRHALAVLYLSSLFVGTDGGLHHAAAAMGKRALVLWTGYSSPTILGYDTHINIDGGASAGVFPLGCGSREVCTHCGAGKERIKPEQIAHIIKGQVKAC